MSTAPAPPAVLAPAPASRARGSLAEVFVRENVERLERRLAQECGAMARGLEALGVGPVIERAVGTEGRGGGRWRPLLTLAAARAWRTDPDDAMDAAVAVELTHTASLLLDDLPCMDDAALRRGQPATHRLVGPAGAILLAVGMLARAVELLGRVPGCGGALAEDWGRTVGLAGMAGGQAMDVALAHAMRGAERRLHRAKSSALPAFALSCGARAAGASETARAGLEAFGRGLGWAYQLQDDAEDQAEDARNGRAPGDRGPALRGARIMALAVRRLARTPGLRPDGFEILVGLAKRVVPLDDAARERGL